MGTDQQIQCALCLSGGGFRAALFHLGALRRLNELGSLSKVAVITSVSGGSILNGIIAMNWPQLAPKEDGHLGGFDEAVARPLRAFCARDLRTPLLVGSRLNPLNWFGQIRDRFAITGNHLAESYEGLYQGRCLTQIKPATTGNTPRFVFCSTSMNTGALWQFHAGENGRMGDFYFGYLSTEGVRLSDAVAASSSFPFAIGPMRLAIGANTQISRVDPWGKEQPVSEKRKPVLESGDRSVSLTDGGVYDNLGVEGIWDRFHDLLVSDAGHPFESAGSCSPFVVSRLGRAAGISAEQVGAVRKRWFVERLKNGAAGGTFWGIDTRYEDYKLDGAKGFTGQARDLFSEIRTDLNAFTEGEMDSLENHGYSLADAAMRSFGKKFCTDLSAEFRWPRSARTDDASVIAAIQNSAKLHAVRDIWRMFID